MRIDLSGRVAENFYVAGPPGVPVYVVDAPRPALFDAGMTAFSKGYVEDIRAILGRRPPAYLFLTHAHFDHVGAVGLFKKAWPDLKIVASAQCRDILTRPNAVSLITALNEGCIKMAEKEKFSPIHRQPFEAVDIDIVAAPDQFFEIGENVKVQALHTPGHTRDFISYWIADRKLLIASEAVGCDDGSGGVLPEFLVDIDAYFDGMARLAQLDVDILCTGHKLVHTGQDARSHLRQSPKSTRRYIAKAEIFLKEEKGDIEGVVQRMKRAEWDPMPWPKQPAEAYLLNTRQRIQKVWERLQIDA